MTRVASSQPHLLHLTLAFPPDGVSTATMQGGIARGLAARGFAVTVITTTPHYNRDPSAELDQPMRPVFLRLVYRSDYGGCVVYHIRVREKGRRILRRVFDYAVFHTVSLAIALTRREHFDVIVAASPPLTIGIAAALVAAARRIPFVYNVQEIYPDVAIDLGVLRNRALIAIARRMEMFIYRRAQVLVTISERFRDRIIAKRVPPAKVLIIPNFANTSDIAPGPKDNAFAVRHGLVGKFVVLYAGNLGLTQDFDTVIAAAEGVPDDVVFLMVGGGSRAAWLEGEIRRHNSPSLRMLPYQDSNHLPDLYATSSVGLVTLIKDAARGTFPSKVYTIMSSGRPCVVVSDLASDAAELVGRTRSGAAVAPGDAIGLRRLIMDLRDHPGTAEEMGGRGRQFVVATHSPDAVVSQYDELLRGLVSRS